MAEIIGDGKDRISELPVHIIHDILRCIRRNGLQEEARTCVLSKTWSSIWRTRPDVIINFNHSDFFKNLENFVKFVDDTLRPYAEQNLSIETLRLRHLHCPQEMASHVDRWIKLAIKLRVRLLDIGASIFVLTCYNIPDSIYTINSTLTVLHLQSCNFETDNSTSTTNKLQRLISTCSLIRDLKLSYCKGFQNFQVKGLVNLEKLELSSCIELVKVEIWAPNLKKFNLHDHRGNLEQVNMLAPNLMEFNFASGKTCMPFSTVDPSSLERANINFYASPSGSYNFGDVDISWYNNLLHFFQKFNYSKGLILVMRCKEECLIYEDSKEIMIVPTRKLELRIENTSMRLESFVNGVMSSRPKIVSVVHGIDSKILQVFHETATAYTKKQYGRLKEVINHKGAADENGGTSPFCTWLKSTSLIERITTFNFKWV